MAKPCFALARGGSPELLMYGSAGQMKLFDSMEALVDALAQSIGELAAAKDGEHPTHPALGGRSADVSVALEQLLPIYEATARRAASR